MSPLPFQDAEQGTKGTQRVLVPHPRSRCVLPAGWGAHFAFCCLPVLCGRCVGKEKERPRVARLRPSPHREAETSREPSPWACRLDTGREHHLRLPPSPRCLPPGRCQGLRGNCFWLAPKAPGLSPAPWEGGPPRPGRPLTLPSLGDKELVLSLRHRELARTVRGPGCCSESQPHGQGPILGTPCALCLTRPFCDPRVSGNEQCLSVSI